jgi:1-acyl-sn-glycerol-3-phosphate acyltransferase
MKTGRKVCFLAKDFLFEIPVFGEVVKMGQNIPVHMKKDGKGTDKDKNAQIAVDILDRIERGYAICVFPEGGIHQETVLGEFKRGIFEIAVTHRIPVHVVRFSKNDDLVPNGWNDWMHPGSSVIKISDFEFIEDYSVENLINKVAIEMNCFQS